MEKLMIVDNLFLFQFIKNMKLIDNKKIFYY